MTQAIATLGIMLNPDCVDPLILVSGINHNNHAPVLYETLAYFALNTEIVNNEMVAVHCADQGHYTRQSEASGIGMKIEEGYGPNMTDYKTKVREHTKNRVFQDVLYDQKELDQYQSNTVLYISPNSKYDNKKRIGTLDVLVVPTRADYASDLSELHEYNPNAPNRPFHTLKSRNPFYVLHAAAPNIGESPHYKPQDIYEYLHENGKFYKTGYVEHYGAIMENIVKVARDLKLQHLILHPFGIGAFMRNLHNYVFDAYDEEDDKRKLRTEMIQKIVEKIPRSQDITYHMCYPTHRPKSLEDKNNQSAIEHAMNDHSNIILQPGIDALALANHLAKLNLLVAMVNYANANRIGNRWYENGAGSATDENIHRRSHMLGLTSRSLNTERNTQKRRSPQMIPQSLPQPPE